ncbi:MAG: SDR family NAD(P)-dependent oxidoreductase [Syntrophales bacterium]|nr:SDR family NAD(P)-dependent oxidoreductase [Syntrophales bacterium]
MIQKYSVAVVTGASIGIGRAVAKQLAQAKVKLILIARREEKLRALAHELRDLTTCYLVNCDLRDHAKLAQHFKELPDAFSAVDILINNAGLALGVAPAQQSSWRDWQDMIDINCTALAHITHLLLPGMVARNRGHVVNIGSVAGTYPYLGGNVYGATKSFVKQFSLNLKADLLGTAVRVTNIEPAMVGGTEFSQVRFKGDEGKAAQVYEGVEPLRPESVADAVLWAVSQPPHVNITRIELMPVCQAASGIAVDRKLP